MDVWDFIGLYWPPDPGDPKAVFRFQLAQSFGVVTIWFVAWVVALWLFGKLPFLPQVAYAGEVQSSAQQLTAQMGAITQENQRITRQLNFIQLLQIRTTINTEFKNLCLAKRTHNQNDLDNANEQLSTLGDQYYSLTGHAFTYQSCDTVLAGDK